MLRIGGNHWIFLDGADGDRKCRQKVKVVYRNSIVYIVDIITKIVTSTWIYRRRNRR
nr:hypothetical protein GZ27A8_45 [uncultured archaeon GZfos27A8]